MSFTVPVMVYVEVEDADAVRLAARRLVIGTEQDIDLPDKIADSFGEHLEPALSAIFGSSEVFEAMSRLADGVPGLRLIGTHSSPGQITNNQPTEG